jgi:fatty-acyl-CoA synthase
MRGLTMNYQLTVPAILHHARRAHGTKAIVSRLPDRTLHRYTYGDCIGRAERLAAALLGFGLRRGDRVATFCWNHSRHLEAYYAVPAAGLVLHTLNLRLHPDDLGYIVRHADDKVIIVDDVLLPAFEKFRSYLGDARVIVINHGATPATADLDYEALIASANESDFTPDVEDEHQAAAMCYTSGTTGRPKGVVYSHRGMALHSMGIALSLLLRESDITLAVVPMFHVNSWGLPYAAALVGASQVLPGPHLDAASLLDLMQSQRVTFAAGVPTIWGGVLQALDANPGVYDLSSVRELMVGGSAAPQSLFLGFERHGIHVIHGWGMTETAPVGSIARLRAAEQTLPEDDRVSRRARQGTPLPFVEIRARGDEGLTPWDGSSMGELEIRGAWVASSYYQNEDPDRFTEDGWLRTGDVVTISPNADLHITDRAKDLIKSGGEWISSVALECALADHEAVLEAAVIAIPHPRWDERPLAVVVFKNGKSATPEELRSFLQGRFAKWWLPDAFVFAPSLPRNATGKILKKTLREQHREHPMSSANVAGSQSPRVEGSTPKP